MIRGQEKNRTDSTRLIIKRLFLITLCLLSEMILKLIYTSNKALKVLAMNDSLSVDYTHYEFE